MTAARLRMFRGKGKSSRIFALAQFQSGVCRNCVSFMLPVFSKLAKSHGSLLRKRRLHTADTRRTLRPWLLCGASSLKQRVSVSSANRFDQCRKNGVIPSQIKQKSANLWFCGQPWCGRCTHCREQPVLLVFARKAIHSVQPI